MNFRSVSCYPGAYPWVSTPNIDRLANEGMRFTNCYTSAWCAPSRATYLTGKLPHGIKSLHLPTTYPNYVRDPDQCPYWLENLRENGWYTGIVGKWHTGPDHGHVHLGPQPAREIWALLYQSEYEYSGGTTRTSWRIFDG